MKFNFFKYIFILFVVAIIIFAIYTIYYKEGKNEVVESQEVVEEQQQIKDLRLGISNFDTINPLLSSNKEVLNIDKLIFEPLLTIDENYKIKMCLASECSKVSETSYIVKINNDIKWSNGTSVIAKDIQFTIDRLKEGKSIYSYNVEKVNGVEVLDYNTVRINLSEEVPFFEYNLTFPILSNNFYMGEDFYASDKTPIGTGMYKIESIDEAGINLVKNENWRNKSEKDCKIEKINIKLFSEIGELYNSFKLGNIDICTTSNNNLEQYIGTIGYSKTEIKDRMFDYIAFNCQNERLSSTEVRKAISKAIDKNNIVSSVYNNKYYVADFPLDYGHYLYNSEKINSKVNQEEAKSILLKDGWEYKYNRWQKKENYRTNRLELTLTVCGSNSERVAVAENIKAQLEKIGIKIKLNKVSDKTYKQVLENKRYELIITGVYNSFSPNLNSFFGDNNLQNYSNSEINNILNEVKSITDEKILKEKYNKIIEIYEKEQPFIGLYRNKATIVKNQNLAGDIKGNMYFSYYGLENWHRF